MSEDTHLCHDGAIAGAAPDSVNDTQGFKHTPGPWSLKFTTHDYGDDLQEFVSFDGIYDAADQKVCVRGIAIAMGGNQNDEAMANARLIAAAPEMLVAIQEIIWASDEPFTLAHVGVDRIEAALTKARAAIAKATGVKS